METAKHPTYTVNFANYRLDLDPDCKPIIDHDAPYVLLSLSDWLNFVLPAIKSENNEAYYNLYNGLFFGPHAITINPNDD